MATKLQKFTSSFGSSRVANLVFMEPDFEIWISFDMLGFFLKSKKSRQNIDFYGSKFLFKTYQ